MGDEKTVKILLKKPILGLDGKIKKNGARLRNEPKFENMTDTEFADCIKDMTGKQLKDMAPEETVGDGIKYILANCIKPANNEEAAKLFTYITKINNVCDTGKGEWVVDEGDLKKFREVIATAKENVSIIYNGQIDGILEKYAAQLTIKKDS